MRVNQYINFAFSLNMLFFALFLDLFTAVSFKYRRIFRPRFHIILYSSEIGSDMWKNDLLQRISCLRLLGENPELHQIGDLDGCQKRWLCVDRHIASNDLDHCSQPFPIFSIRFSHVTRR